MRNTVKSHAWILGLATIFVLGSRVNAADAKPTPEMEAMMKQGMERGMPGANHKVLEPFVGKWTNTVTFWMKPGDKPQVTQGTNDNTWILDGRFVKQDYKSVMHGRPFEGLGITGYDNIRGEYQSIWLDNMMTGIMMGTGPYDAAAKTVKVSGAFSCPMTNEKEHWYRSEWKVVSNDKHTYTAYDKTPEGKEFKNMEIVFTRVK